MATRTIIAAKRPRGDHLQVPGVDSAGSVSIFNVLTIARRYGATIPRTPTKEQLMADFGMSRATAYRWINGFDAARGVVRPYTPRGMRRPDAVAPSDTEQ